MKGLLRWIARRCEIHDRAWPSVIRSLETDLGLEPPESTGSFADSYCNPNLIDCGHEWCRKRRQRVIHHRYGYSPADHGVRPGIPPREPAGALSACSTPRRLPEVGGHASTDTTVHDLPTLPAWVVQRQER